jgi:hypothetical protein
MSRTIITNSGSDFFTNVSSEKLIGELCKIAGAKYSNTYQELRNDRIQKGLDTSNLDVSFQKFPKLYSNTMAYKITEAEAIETSDKLLNLLPKSQELFEEFKDYFGDDTTVEDFKSFIQETANDFLVSKGYNCV